MFKNQFCILFLVFGGAFGLNFQSLNDAKIVGGQAAIEGQFPHQVSLQFTIDSVSFHSCGGTIFNDKTIITTAQCCDGNFPLEKVVAGELSFTLISGHEQIIVVDRTIIHPAFEISGIGFPSNDICLLITKTAINLDDQNVASLPIGTDDQCQIGSTCFISGWGNLSPEDDAGSQDLMFAEIPILADSECKKYGSGFNSTIMTCAGITGGKVGLCSGDHGGPLTCNGALCGVISFSRGCAEKGYPGIFTKVKAFENWIKENAEYNIDTTIDPSQPTTTVSATSTVSTTTTSSHESSAAPTTTTTSSSTATTTTTTTQSETSSTATTTTTTSSEISSSSTTIYTSETTSKSTASSTSSETSSPATITSTTSSFPTTSSSQTSPTQSASSSSTISSMASSTSTVSSATTDSSGTTDSTLSTTISTEATKSTTTISDKTTTSLGSKENVINLVTILLITSVLIHFI